jgi:NAD(P)H-dependent FMN reductase
MSTQTTKPVVKRIVGLAGSLRAGSFNRRLLAAVASELPADVTLEVWDGLEHIPPFTGAGPRRWRWPSSGVSSRTRTGW